MPSAMTSQRTIPPKILIRTVLTLSSDSIILKASATLSASAVPPTSRKLAGSPLRRLALWLDDQFSNRIRKKSVSWWKES